MRRQGPHQSRIFLELSALILNILRSPPTPIHFPDDSLAVPSLPSVSSLRRPQQISPAGFASLLLGISLTLMLCGSITFFIGFMLMPWVLGLVMVFCVVGIVSSLSILGRAILCHATAPAAPRKEVSDHASFFLLEVLVGLWQTNFIFSSRVIRVPNSRVASVWGHKLSGSVVLFCWLYYLHPFVIIGPMNSGDCLLPFHYYCVSFILNPGMWIY